MYILRKRKSLLNITGFKPELGMLHSHALPSETEGGPQIKKKKMVYKVSMLLMVRVLETREANY